jgi:predicted nucleic acid-binding protein
LDASVTLSWHFEDERGPESLDVLRLVTGGGAVVPAHWQLEVANGLVMATRRGRLAADRRRRVLLSLAMLPISSEAALADGALMATVDLAERHRLTVYDAAYLELATRRALPLATLDKQLADAGRRSGLAVLP